MTATFINGLHSHLAATQVARSSNPLPAEHLTAPADLAIRASLALMPFTAIAWLFIAH